MRLGIAKRHRFVELSPCVHRFLLAVQPPLNGVGRFLQSTLSLHPCLELQRCLSSTFLTTLFEAFMEAFLAALLQHFLSFAIQPPACKNHG